jgi:23S rRNA pseudouridine1911/1915/1917 synthase
MIQPNILSETDDYWVIDKPASYAVEPINLLTSLETGNHPTILDWLVGVGRVDKNNWSPEQRYGVVHRLDVETSGVLIWAKNQTAQEKLKLVWQGRVVQKTYLGLVVGELEQKQGSVEIPLMRDNKKDRQTVSILANPKARPAITKYRHLGIAKIGQYSVSLIEAHPITGRTHQIRVHLKYLGHPIIGDKLYGDKISREIAQKLGLNRHFLHAWKLCLNQKDCYTAPISEDLEKIIAKLGLKGLID